MDKRQYRVLPGQSHGSLVVYGPGDIVELTEAEAGPLLGWRLELVEPEPAPAEKPKAETKQDEKPALKRKEKAS